MLKRLESKVYENLTRKSCSTASVEPVDMQIDAHQHFWVYDPGEYEWIDDSMESLRRDFLPRDLKPELDRNGFQGCVAVQVRQTLEETQWLLDLARDTSF